MIGHCYKSVNRMLFVFNNSWIFFGQYLGVQICCDYIMLHVRMVLT